MKVINIDFKNKQFETDNGEVFPFIFEVDEFITIEEFQKLINESEAALKKLLNNNG